MNKPKLCEQNEYLVNINCKNRKPVETVYDVSAS